jgi:aminomethyltransferase
MKKTPIHDEHLRLGARIIDFNGFAMPIQYTSIIEEVLCVRRKVGLFDLTHMGRLEVTGSDREAAVQAGCSKSVAKVPVWAARYGLLLTPEGTIKDDVLLYREPEMVHVVVNCANRDRDHRHFVEHAEGLDAEVRNVSDEQAMLALQGPASKDVLAPLAEADLDELGYYRFLRTRVADTDVILSRTGYTGEDGFELFLAPKAGAGVWRRLLESGRDHGIQPIGLGARDILRLEAAMPLYGQELTLDLNPFEADVGFGVSMKSEFTGKGALRAAKEAGLSRKRIGFVGESRRIAREGMEIHAGEEKVGWVTSGTWSPTLEQAIGMGYAGIDHTEVGTRLFIDIKGKRAPARVVELPFYKRER